MKPEDINVAVLQIEGTNCEHETARAFLAAGTNAEIVHLNELISNKKKISDYHVLMFPGGFSAGDYVRAGSIFASRIRAKLETEINNFISEGYVIGGICNGFQILTELGVLPGLSSDGMISEPELVLTNNHSGKFECVPTLLKHTSLKKTAFTLDIERDSICKIPSAHAEGRLFFKNENILKDVEENGQVIFRYVNENGEVDGYPWNPNGSPGGIAALSNLQGNVFGMMPHPERSLMRYTHNDWGRERYNSSVFTSEYGDGYPFFTSVINYLSKRL